VDLGAAVVADEQSLEVMQPGEGALDDPARSSQAGAVLRLAARDLGSDPALAQLPAVLVVVVAAISGNASRPATRTANLPTHGRHSFNQRDQLGDVVTVAARDRPGERDPGGVD
jgi:hypothetical protein